MRERLPRLNSAIALVDVSDGKARKEFTRYWDKFASAIEDRLFLISSGIVVSLGGGEAIGRTITGSAGVSVTNGAGVSGNPTVSLTDTSVTSGAYGDASHVASVTFDQKGRATAAAAVAIAFPVTSVFGRTGMVTMTAADISDASANGRSLITAADYAAMLTLLGLSSAVSGPGAAISGNIPTFSGTTGKLLQDSGKALPTGAIVGTTDTQTLSAKALTGRVDGASAAPGVIGEYLSAGSTGQNANVTITIATPGIVSWTAHGLALGSPVQFTTTGALPTGLAVSTTYWVIPVDANSFQIASSIANSIAGTAITTSGSQSGTHTGIGEARAPNSTTVDAAFLVLSPGDWEVQASMVFDPNSTTITTLNGFINTASAAPVTRPNSGAQVLLQGSYTISVTLLVGSRRINVSSQTTVYLSGLIVNGSTDARLYGFISARRVN